jgi:hypothetical protein
MVCLKLKNIRWMNVGVREAASTSMLERSVFTRIPGPDTRYLTASAAHDA